MIIAVRQYLTADDIITLCVDKDDDRLLSIDGTTVKFEGPQEIWRLADALNIMAGDWVRDNARASRRKAR